MNQDAFNVYLLCTAALAFNLWFLAGFTGARRGLAKVFVNPEDADLFKGETEAKDVAKVERVKAAHRNALENILPFMILGLLYVSTGAEKNGAMAYFVTFTVARWAHSLCYLAGVQPWRTAMFTIGYLVNIGLTIQLILVALG